MSKFLIIFGRSICLVFPFLLRHGVSHYRLYDGLPESFVMDSGGNLKVTDGTDKVASFNDLYFVQTIDIETY